MAQAAPSDQVLLVLIDRKGFSKHLPVAVGDVQPQVRVPVRIPGHPEVVLLFQLQEQRDGVLIYLEVGEFPRIEIVPGLN